MSHNDRPIPKISFRSSGFGDYADIEIPDDCQAVLVCGWRGSRMETEGIYLPHQLYREKIIAWFEKYDRLQLIPMKTMNAIGINRASFRWRDEQAPRREIQIDSEE